MYLSYDPELRPLTPIQDKESIASAPVAENDSAISAKSKTQEYTEKTKNYLSEKIPQERREQTVWRLKKMVIEIQGHADCRLHTRLVVMTDC